MDEEEFIKNFGMTREQYAQEFGSLQDPNLGKDATLRQKSVDKVAGTLQNLGFTEYSAYNQANRLLGNVDNPLTEGGIGVLDFTPVQIPFAIQEGKRALQEGDYLQGVLGLVGSGLEMLPAAKLFTTPVKNFFKNLGNKISTNETIDQSRRSAMAKIAAAPLAVGALSEVPVDKVVDEFDFIDEVDKVPFEPIAKTVPLPKDFNPISDLLEVKETIDDIIRLDIEDDIDELDDIDDIIEQQGLSRRTEIAKEDSIAGIPEMVIKGMREKYKSSDDEIVEVLNKFLDIEKKDAKDLVESVD